MNVIRCNIVVMLPRVHPLNFGPSNIQKQVLSVLRLIVWCIKYETDLEACISESNSVTKIYLTQLES